MKTCTVCEKEQPLANFRRNRRAKDGHAPQCKTCADIATEKWRQVNLDKRKRQMTELRQQLAARFREWKGEQGCCKCDETEPACLDLHHLDPSEKDDTLSAMIHRCHGWDSIMVEAAKCVVVCRNCHAKIHVGLLEV